MSNVLSYNFNRIGYTYKADEPILKNTQTKLDKHYDGEMIRALLDNVVKSIFEEENIINNLCGEIEKWIVPSDKSKNEVSFLMHKNIKALVNKIKNNDECSNIFTFEDEKINIWVLVEEANYETSTKYIELARSELKEDYKYIDIMIYGQEEIEEVKEELEEIKYKSWSR